MEDYAKYLSRLQDKCSRCECCSSDVRRKAMTAFEGDSVMADRLVEELRRDRFIDDERYAASFAREKSRLSGWGPAKISYGLLKKGIDRNAIKAALAEVDEDEAMRKMVSVLEAKWKFLRDDPSGKFKLLKFGLSRGYEYEALAPVVENIVHRVEDESDDE